MVVQQGVIDWDDGAMEELERWVFHCGLRKFPAGLRFWRGKK